MPKEKSGIDVCISFDTTGSMYPCLTQVRRTVGATVKRLFRDIPDLRIAIIAHGDYCDKESTYVTKVFDFSSNVKSICDFVERVGSTYGGDTPECYELVLREARGLSWTAGKAKAFVVIGDDVPHEPNYPGNTQKIDWRNELKLLLEMDVNVYGVHAMPGIRKHSKWFYEAIAKATKGFYLTLDQFAAITDIIFAVCYKQTGNDGLRAFQQEVVDAHRMNRNLANVFQALGGMAVDIEDVGGGLVPVPAGRFQVLQVGEDDRVIRDFVTDQGLTFEKGRGFYEFTKTETVQEKKEVVLVDRRTGDMFSGAAARDMIGVPFGTRGRVKPTDIERFQVFVQSTSWNRSLKAGTDFLYEVNDWDRPAEA